MDKFWNKVLNFMADYSVDFDELSRLTEVSVEDLKKFTEEGHDIENAPNTAKINYYVDYFMSKEDWQLEAESKLYLIKTKLSARRIEDYLNVLCLEPEELYEILFIPKKAFDIITEQYKQLFPQDFE